MWKTVTEAFGQSELIMSVWCLSWPALLFKHSFIKMIKREAHAATVSAGAMHCSYIALPCKAKAGKLDCLVLKGRTPRGLQKLP